MARSISKIGSKKKVQNYGGAITPCLWFDKNAEEAVNFYLGVFKNSRIKYVSHYGESGAGVSGLPKGAVMTIAFTINGQDFLALNGGPVFKFSEAISFMVHCETQEEVDELWEKLTEGGEESQCGWLKDKFGLSWQIVPNALTEMMQEGNGEKQENMMKAMLQMKKLDIKLLRQAYNGETTVNPEILEVI